VHSLVVSWVQNVKKNFKISIVYTKEIWFLASNFNYKSRYQKSYFLWWYFTLSLFLNPLSTLTWSRTRFLYSFEQWTLHSRIWFVNKKQNDYFCNFQWMMTGCYSLVVIFQISTGNVMLVYYSVVFIWVLKCLNYFRRLLINFPFIGSIPYNTTRDKNIFLYFLKSRIHKF
jgi:hypothetical protein